MPDNALPRDWQANLRLLKRWLLAYGAAWVVFWVVLVASNGSEVAALPVIPLLVAYVACIVYAYRVQKGLNEAKLYSPGAWQVIVGALLFNPLLVGWLIPVSVVWVARRGVRAGAA